MMKQEHLYCDNICLKCSTCGYCSIHHTTLVSFTHMFVLPCLWIVLVGQQWAPGCFCLPLAPVYGQKYTLVSYQHIPKSSEHNVYNDKHLVYSMYVQNIQAFTPAFESSLLSSTLSFFSTFKLTQTGIPLFHALCANWLPNTHIAYSTQFNAWSKEGHATCSWC